jgi:hypothetical protein
MGMTVIADFFQSIEGDLFVLFGTEFNFGSNFSSDNDMFSGNENFAGDTAFRITDDEAIDDTVGDDIGTFIGVPWGDDFRSKEVHKTVISLLNIDGNMNSFIIRYLRQKFS